MRLSSSSALPRYSPFFFLNATPSASTYTLSLHDALPIFLGSPFRADQTRAVRSSDAVKTRSPPGLNETEKDRKSTRLNSSHVAISYAVFCLKKKRAEH